MQVGRAVGREAAVLVERLLCLLLLWNQRAGFGQHKVGGMQAAAFTDRNVLLPSWGCSVMQVGLVPPACPAHPYPHLAQQRGGGQAAEGVAAVGLVPGLASHTSLVRLCGQQVHSEVISQKQSPRSAQPAALSRFSQQWCGLCKRCEGHTLLMRAAIGAGAVTDIVT